MIVVLLFLRVAWVCLQLVIVIFPDHTHLLFFAIKLLMNQEMAVLLLSCDCLCYISLH